MIRRADPQLVQEPLTLEKLTYDEALEFGYHGAGIFHHDAISPCRESGVPIHVIDTLNPHRRTRILYDREPDEHEVVGITYKAGFRGVDVTKGSRDKRSMPGLTQYVLQTEHGNRGEIPIPIEQIASGVSRVSFIVPGEFSDEVLHERKRHLIDYFGLHENEVSIGYNISLLSIVLSKGIKDKPGISVRADGPLALLGISKSHITQGGQQLSIIYAVPEEGTDPLRAQAGVRAVYREFFVDHVFKNFILQQQRLLQNRNP